LSAMKASSILVILCIVLVGVHGRISLGEW
jgi:hypothetical protein